MVLISDEGVEKLQRVRQTLRYFAIKFLIHGHGAVHASELMEEVFAELVEVDEQGGEVSPHPLTQ